MIECNLFDIEVHLQNRGNSRILVYTFATDLPVGTRLCLLVNREYLNNEDGLCLWNMHDETITVAKSETGSANGGSGEIDIDKSDKLAWERYNSRFVQYASGIKSMIPDELNIGIIMGVKQSLTTFGKNNCNLTGKYVENRGGNRVMKVVKKIRVPIISIFQQGKNSR